MDAVIDIGDDRQVFGVASCLCNCRQAADDTMLVQSLPRVHNIQVSEQRPFLDRIAAGEVVRITLLRLLSHRGCIAELQDTVEIITVPVHRVHERHFRLPCVLRQSGRIDLIVLAAPVVDDLEANLLVCVDLPVARYTCLVTSQQVIELTELAHFYRIDIILISSEVHELFTYRKAKFVMHFQVDIS